MQYDAIQPMGLLLAAVTPEDPRFDLGMFMRAVVVGYQMQGQPTRGLGIQLLEERQPLSVRVLGWKPR